jgi:hypothetical protein
MKRKLLILAMLILGTNGFSQITTYDNTNLTYCIGQATFQDTTLYSSWFWTDSNSNPIQTNGSNIYSLCGGDYYVYVTDLSNNIDTIPFTINDTVDCSSINVSLSVISSPSLGNCDGELQPIISSAAWPYTYTWSNGQTTQNITNLCPDPYTLTLVDGNGCIATATTILTDTIPVPVDILTTDNTDSINCNGTANIFSDTSSLSSWYWSNASGTTLMIAGDYLTGLCAGTYYFISTSINNTIDSVAFIITDDFPCQNFNISTATAYDYNSNCIGVSTSSTTGGTAPFVYTYSNGLIPAATSQYGPNVSQVWNLCEGTYNVTVIDANGCTTGTAFYIGDSTNITALDINAITVSSSSNSLCDGSVIINISGGSSPYIVNNDTLNSPILLIDSLCPGPYTTTVTDANGTSISISYLISTDSTTIINNPYSGSGSISIDSTTNGIVENCQINYQNIDSANVTGVNIIAADSIIVDYTIYYNNGSSEIVTEVYQFNYGAGVYTVILDLFCPNKSTLNFLKVIDEINYDPNMIGTAWKLGIDAHDFDVNVYPNPFNTYLIIELEEVNNYDISIYDIAGKLVLSTNFENTNRINLDLLNLNKGQYIVRIQNNHTVITKKIIK